MDERAILEKGRIQGDEGAIHDLGVAAQLRFEQSRILTECLRQILNLDPGIFGRRGRERFSACWPLTNTNR